jgi:hypothetical protein
MKSAGNVKDFPYNTVKPISSTHVVIRWMNIEDHARKPDKQI